MGNPKQAVVRRQLRQLAGVLLCLWGMGLCASQMNGQETSNPTRVKAVNLTRVLSFVKWPGDWMSNEESTFHICVVGDYWLVYALTEETRTAVVSGRKIKVRRIQKEQELRSCQMVFVSGTEEKKYGRILEVLKGRSALTVGETDGFLRAGGIVEFSFDTSPIRVAINLAAARNAKLKLDARLLAMAKRVVTDKELPGG